ncbi:hypothetical protein ACWC9H_27195 [Streptomyces sp. NPDC001251]
MTENTTAPQPHGMEPLPAPMRVMSAQEARRVHDAVRAAARRRQVTASAADEVSYDALAAAGVFLAPDPLDDPDLCTARYLPHDPDEFGPDLLGVWQQCADEPGHDGDDHDTGELNWRDGMPGAIPATTPGGLTR